jgi:glycosyltransferase involved in cell wall biosynthesis
MKDPYVPGETPGATIGREQMGVPVDMPLLLFVGRLILAKGVHELIEALARVNTVRTCHCLCLGEGPERASLVRRARALGIEQRVTFGGYVGPDRLFAAYRSADLFVLPSWAEGFPVAILEAMDCSLPIVTTRIRGMADHVVEGENGLFVPLRDPPALAAAILRLLEDESLRRRLGEGGQLKLREFSPVAVAREHLSAFAEALSPIRQGNRKRDRKED